MSVRVRRLLSADDKEIYGALQLILYRDLSANAGSLLPARNLPTPKAFFFFSEVPERPNMSGELTQFLLGNSCDRTTVEWKALRRTGVPIAVPRTRLGSP